jgi:hypothetical protein
MPAMREAGAGFEEGRNSNTVFTRNVEQELMGQPKENPRW